MFLTICWRKIPFRHGEPDLTPNVRRWFEKLERQKADVLSEISGWSAERLRFQPSPSSWSTLAVLDHLVKVEESLLLALQSSLPDGHSVPFKDRLGGLAVTCVMLSPMRVKVPTAAKIVVPDTVSDPLLVTNRWNKTRAELANLLNRLSPMQIRRGLFRHPVSGWMTVQRTLAFLSAHLGHHRYQLKRLRQATRAL